MNKTELMTEIMKLTGHSRSIQPEVHFGILRLIDKYVESEKSARIRELEGVIGKCNEIFLLALIWDNGTLSEDRISDFEKGLEYIKQALNKKEQSL